MAASFCRRSFIHYKNSLFKLQYRTGYVILIPEAPDDVAENEIFSKTGHTLNFEKVSWKECKHLMVRKSQMYDIGSWELDDHVKNLMEKNEEIDLHKHILGPLELLYVPFFSTWGLTQTLYYGNSELMPSKVYHSLHRRAGELRYDKFRMEPIFKACKKLSETMPEKYNNEEHRVINKLVWEGTRNGLDIKEEQKEKLYDLFSVVKYRNRSYLNKWTNAMFYFKQMIGDPKVTDHFPPDLLRGTALDVEQPEKGPWILDLKPRIYNRFMEYCDSRQSRLHFWLSLRQICSRHGDSRFRADLEVEDLRDQRAAYARLLGYPTYAHLAMKSKMADDLEEVHDVLEVLLEKAKLGQEVELYNLEQFAQNNNFAGQIELWDIDFWGRLQKKELFDFDELALQAYFPLSQVLLGLFALCEQLFGIILEEDKNLSVWNKDVKFFRVLDERTKKDLGGFYFDPYARRTKRMDDKPGGLCIIMGVGSKICKTLPSVSLIFYFSPPTEDKPSLLLFHEVEDLFLKFGQALQHILSDTQYAEVGGFTNLEPDVAAVCGKFLKRWLYEKGTLESVSGHYNTGDPLPNHILEGICKMQHHLAGIKLSQDIYMAHLDFQLSIDNECCMPIVERLWPQHFLFDLQDVDHHPFGLKNLYIENEACQYYSKIWSDMIAADVFRAFEEAGFKNHEEISLLGRRFRSTYYSLAGGTHPKEVFKRFRGRSPSPIPYLELIGLKDLKPSLDPPTETSKIAST